MKRVPPNAKIVSLRVPIVCPALYYLKTQTTRLFAKSAVMALLGAHNLHSVYHAHQNVSSVHLTTSRAAVLYVQPAHL
jgi:hypothetical protein